MVSYDDPGDIAPLEKQIEEKQETPAKSTLKNVDSRIIGLAGLGALFLFYLYYTGKADVKFLALALIGILAVVFLMAQAQTRTKPTLTFEECCWYLNRHLSFMRARKWGPWTQLDQDTEYKLLPITRERFIDGKHWKRVIGVKLKSKTGLVQHYMGEIDVITGDLLSFIRVFGEWDGRGLDDIRTAWRPSEELSTSRRAKQYLGLEPKRKEAY